MQHFAVTIIAGKFHTVINNIIKLLLRPATVTLMQLVTHCYFTLISAHVTETITYMNTDTLLERGGGEIVLN